MAATNSYEDLDQDLGIGIEPPRAPRTWAPVLVGALGLLASFLFWRMLLGFESNQIHVDINHQAQSLATLIERDLDLRAKGLRRMASRWAVQGGTPEAEWEADAASYLGDFLSYQAIEWVDEAHCVRRIAPLEGNECALGLCLREEPNRKAALNEAIATRRVILSKPVDLVQGGQGVIILAPIYAEDTYGGCIAASMRIDSWLDYVLSDFPRDFICAVYASGSVVRQSGPSDEKQKRQWAAKASFRSYGASWRVEVWPTALRLKMLRTGMPIAALVAGMLLTFLFARNAHLIHLSRHNTISARKLSDDLQKEVQSTRRAQRKLHEANLFLDSIIENIPDMIFLKEAEHLRFVRFNRAGEELLGYPRDDLLGKNDYDFFPCEEADIFTAKDRDVLSQRDVVEIDEEPIHTRLKGIRYLHTKKIPITDAAGRPRYLLGISEDITRRKEREAEAKRRVEEMTQINRGMANLLEDLQAANRKLETVTRGLRDANEELGAFSYSVSHDLRAPLRAIHGFARALQEDFGEVLNGEGHRFLDRILNNAADMGHLIDDLLSFSRLSRQALTARPIDMKGLCETVIDGLGDSLGSRDIGFRVGDLAVAQGDAAMVQHVWQNLIANAVKFTRTAEPAIIEIGGIVDEGKQTYYVRDNGVGFDMQYADRLFGVFQRLHTTDEYEGTGVGLAIVERIVKRHGGRVWVEAALGKGATFFFTLSGNQGDTA